MPEIKKFLVLDTETTGGLGKPLAYDVGGVVVDASGYVWERFHWGVLEILGNPSKMATAFYSEKMPMYWEEVAAGNIVPLHFADILRRLTGLVDFHHITAVAAYNAAFDLRSMSNTSEFMFGDGNSRWLNRDTPTWDIWAGACTSVLDTAKFCRWACTNGQVSDKGNPKTSAEVCFRYITGKTDFTEEHTGGRDAEIEAAILVALLRCKKNPPKFDIIPGGPWRIPAKRYKAMAAEGKLPKIAHSLNTIEAELKKAEGPHHYTDSRRANRLG